MDTPLTRDVDNATSRRKGGRIKNAKRSPKLTSWTLPKKKLNESTAVLAVVKCAMEYQLRRDRLIDSKTVGRGTFTETYFLQMAKWLKRMVPGGDKAYQLQRPECLYLLYSQEGSVLLRQRADRFFNNAKERRNGIAELPSKNVASPAMPLLYDKVQALLKIDVVLTWQVCTQVALDVQRELRGRK